MSALPVDASFFLIISQIMLVNLLLSGDNAVVIALAARSLPPSQQGKAILWGSLVAVVMRVILTTLALYMLQMPYLKLIGGLILLLIAYRLMLPQDEESSDAGSANPVSYSVITAIRMIVIADLIMSLDNVLAVAAFARGSTLLLWLGLAMSIPMVMLGSRLLLRIMECFPIAVVFGAGLLAYVAAEMLLMDSAWGLLKALEPDALQKEVISILCASTIIFVGYVRSQQMRKAAPARLN